MPSRLTALLAIALLLAACGPLGNAERHPVTVAAVGDIACPPEVEPTTHTCRHADTAELVSGAQPDAVLILGDAQYQRGTLAEFQGSYDATWGRFLDITHPSPGNHDYYTPGASGYFEYFGARARPAGTSWYAFDLGTWRLYALDSNCDEVGGCGPGSPQYEWLRAQLEASDHACALAYWHHARFSSGPHGNDERMAQIWELLDLHGVDLALTGHDHTYERFESMRANGTPDTRAIRQFVVGTGGARHYPLGRRVSGSESSYSGAFGVLFVELGDGSYRWSFRSVSGKSFTDEGEADCA